MKGKSMTILHSRFGAASIQYDGETYEADEGAFDFPDDVAEVLHHLHADGVAAFEDNHERETRLEEERLARRRDPSTLLEAVEALTAVKLTVAELRAQLAEAEAEEAAEEAAGAEAAKAAEAAAKAAAKKK